MYFCIILLCVSSVRIQFDSESKIGLNCFQSSFVINNDYRISEGVLKSHVHAITVAVTVNTNIKFKTKIFFAF